jgi:hypothetical protein
VADASCTVTFWPAVVVSVKPDADTPLTVPTEPPAAGPDRALDPPAPDPEPPAREWPLLMAVGVVVALLDVALTIP